MGGRSSGKPGRRVVREAAEPYGSLDQLNRLERAIDLLGATEVAKVIGVAKSQPGRWRSGAERIGHANLTRLLELDLIVSRLLLAFGDRDGVASFLDGTNAFLNFARPRVVMQLEGPLAILVAIEGWEQGAYA